MNNRQRLHAIMNYEQPDRMPAVHFGFTPELLANWVKQGHVSSDILDFPDYSFECEDILSEKLGFDFGWNPCGVTSTDLSPCFEARLVEHLENGFDKYLNHDGVFILRREGAGSIPSEVDHLLKDRKSWEELYLPRLTYSEDRFSQRALDHLLSEQKKGNPAGLHCGSLCGRIRDYLGLVGLSYLTVDDEDLLEEISQTIGKLCVQAVRRSLEADISYDYAHFWEDMCYKNGPLISPQLFESMAAPFYKEITELLSQHGISIVSVDCDGKIDSFLPIWLRNGVNTMFPIEVGTWDASIEPWRAAYGKKIRGVGGMRKRLFALDYAAIDEEIKRLAPMAKSLGYIPCPDHRLPLDAKWENVQYYCERIKDLYRA